MTMTVSLTALASSGAMFGFFYAWVCSTMWGLDSADPRVAIAAMQAMNASVRNAVFAPAFFGTAPILLLAGLFSRRRDAPVAAAWFVAAALTYAIGGNGITFAASVPMNDALAAIAVPEDVSAAAAVWSGYSTTWQIWNVARAAACGGVLVMAGLGVAALSRADAVRQSA